jgi:hypothetical protein
MKKFTITEMKAMGEEVKFIITNEDGAIVGNNLYDSQEEAQREISQIWKCHFSSIYRNIEIHRVMNSQDIHNGFIGFTDMSEAEQVAALCDGEVHILHNSKDSYYYEDKGWTDEYMSSEYYAESLRIIYDNIEVVSEDDIICLAKNGMDLDVNTITDLITFNRDMLELANKFWHKSETEDIITRHNLFFEKVQTAMMEFHTPLGYYVIGVLTK